MARIISEKLYNELLTYLVTQPEEDLEAGILYQDLQQAEIDQAYEELKIEGKLPQQTKGGAYII